VKRHPGLLAPDSWILNSLCKPLIGATKAGPSGVGCLLALLHPAFKLHKKGQTFWFGIAASKGLLGDRRVGFAISKEAFWRLSFIIFSLRFFAKIGRRPPVLPRNIFWL